MRKILLLTAFFAIGLTSCSDDDEASEDNSFPASIEGKWKYYKEGVIVGEEETLVDYVNDAPQCGKDSMELLSSGIAKSTYFYSDGSCHVEVTTGTWSKFQNNVTIVLDGEAIVAEIIALDDSILKVKYTEADVIHVKAFQRV